MTEIPPEKKKDQNTPEVHKITKMPPKPKNYENTPKIQKKLSKYPSKPKKWPKYHQNLKNGQNNLEA